MTTQVTARVQITIDRAAPTTFLTEAYSLTMARNERITDPLAGIPASRRKRFKALIETGEAFQDVPVEEIEREVARLIKEDRAEQRARREPAPKP